MILDMLRKGQTWVTKGILIVLAITFAFGFGFSFSNFGFGGKVPEGTSAEVNGQKISLLDFYRARERLRAQYRESGVPEEALNQNFIDMTALNQLIDLQLLSQKAKELGFMVTDEELSEAIRSNSVFQVDGQFIGLNEYRAFVEQRLNQSVSDFEKMYREELLPQKVVKLMFDRFNVKGEVEADIKKEGGKALFREFLENLKESVDKKSIDEITKENGLGEVKVVGPISVTAKLDDIPSKVDV